MRPRTFRESFAWSRGVLLLPVALCALPVVAEDARRQIEEVVVTAERRESTVSDTSISITAFTGEMLEDFGIRNQEDLQNLVPAAVIEPYDMAIRGVGRNFRSLGGDPGIATYLNGVYSEDFGIASTEGGLFDVERIEFLRGPQGTLYGRNAIGGAVNFINKKPTEEFEGEARVLYGDYSLEEWYGVVSGPVIPDFMQARFTGVKRTRDGYYEDQSGHDDPGNYGDENYALYLRFTPTDNIEINTRGNERSYARMMGGADAAGIVNYTENGGLVRDTTTFMFGYRPVDPNLPCPNALTRVDPAYSPLNAVGSTALVGLQRSFGCSVVGQQTFTFENPVTGQPVLVQRTTPGVDGNTTPGSNPFDYPNFAYGADPSRQFMLGTEDLEGNDLKTDTNGQQDEYFDQQANSTDITWQVTDAFAVKYIFGYTDYFYDRETEIDLTSNETFDQTFYVSQETEYVSHELQFFFDPTENLTFTTGLFAYNAKITQRGDDYDYTCRTKNPCPSRYANNFPVPYAAIDPGLAFLDFAPKMDLFTARHFGNNLNGPIPFYCGQNPTSGSTNTCFGGWAGDTGDKVQHGSSTPATYLEYQTRTERDAFAAYTQGVYTFNEHFALTLGVRWARDELYGEENLFAYLEGIVPLGGTGCVAPAPPAGSPPGTPPGPTPATCGMALTAVNQAFGWMGPNGEILNPNRFLTNGLPASLSLWRELERDDDDITWRANLDWTPTDDTLIYLSATKGFRAGGFNLVFFSAEDTYNPEELIAYELGYKGTLLDGQMQVNAATYFYDYENVHTFAAGSGALGYGTNVVAVPTAEMIGFDADITWLMTDRFTLGANVSYTHSEYTEDFFVIDPNDPLRPPSLFNPGTQQFNIEGNQLLRVPESKGGAYGQYALPIGSLGRVEFLVNWSYISRVYFSVFEADDQSAPEYQRVDFRTAWYSEDESWNVAFFVNNVFDEIGIRQIDQYGATEENNYRRSGATTDPRLYGLELRYHFGGT